MRRITVAVLSIFAITSAWAQYPDNIFNQDLRVWLKENTYDNQFDDLGYNQARIQMYSYVDEVDGMIECVYTGFQQEAEAVTFPNPMNAEHVVPQSFYNSQSPMRSDIYNLRPTHMNANSERGNLGFDEVPDATATWYGVTNNSYVSTSSEPDPNDAYSERGGGDWEPREDRKGDIARQVFYFYTMYPTQGGSIAGLASVEQLYAWHLEDPVSESELTRNDRAEIAQGNRNPYVDWEGLVYDAWLWEPTDGINDHGDAFDVTVFPTPQIRGEAIFVTAPLGTEISILDQNGKTLSTVNTATTKAQLDINGLGSGIYFIRFQAGNAIVMRRIVVVQ